MSVSSVSDVLIIGGGFSGVSLAANLVKRSSQIRVTIVDPHEEGEFGLAYSGHSPLHLLNVPASGMSMYPDEPDHFLRWACKMDSNVTPHTFLPRATYGKYLHETLDTIVKTGQVSQVRKEAVSIHRSPDGWKVLGVDGQAWFGRKVVLAFGNLPSSMPSGLERISHEESVFPNPWVRLTASQVSHWQTVAIIGSGLTALDIVLYLQSVGFAGKTVLISRHALLPQVHRLDVLPFPSELVPPPQNSVRQLMKEFRRAASLAQQLGSDWRAVFDSIRPNVSDYWTALDLKEKRRFMKHVRPYWDVHRHRISPQVHAKLESLLAAEALQQVKGTVQDVVRAHDDRGWTVVAGSRRDPLKFVADAVFNCTGSPTQVKYWPSPVIQDLLTTQLISIHPTGIGLVCTQDGEVVQADGNSNPDLYAVGILRRGELWESIAVPDIRRQTSRLAELLLVR